MVKPKAQSKKPKKRGVDFKKIKRKIGRRLPRPSNATNVEIKSRAIVLPEQSIASDKAGLAVSKKGLTLKELLQQTSHHNSKVRKAHLSNQIKWYYVSSLTYDSFPKDALLGIRNILLTHPAELKLHKLAFIEKMRERIGDHDKLVRENLYQLFKSVIFPGCKEDNQGPIVSLMMPYIFNAMTHLAIEVRLMAFKFFDLTIEHYPSSISLYAEKILCNYEHILRKNQFFDDKGKLRSLLSGLARCLSLLPRDGRDQSSFDNDFSSQNILHAFESEAAQEPIRLADICKKLKDLLPILVSCFLDFMPLVHSITKLDAQSCDCMQSILQNIDLIARFITCGGYGSESDQHGFLPYLKPDKIAHDDGYVIPRTMKKLWDVFPLNLVDHLSGKDGDRLLMLNVLIIQIFLRSSDWNYSPPSFVEKFLEFFESSLPTKIQVGKVLQGKHLLTLIPYIPNLTMRISGEWRSRILQAFTSVFQNCSPESSMKLACLSAIEEILAHEESWLSLDTTDPILLEYLMLWMRDLPSLLIYLDDKNPLCSKAVLRLQLGLGQKAPVNSPISREIDSMQYGLGGFYCKHVDNDICYGPFVRLSAEIQELALCCLRFFSFIESELLQSLVSCCLYDDLEPHILFRILELLDCAFRDGHIQIAEYASFHLTLLSRFHVYPEKVCPAVNYDGKSNRKLFNSITSIVCKYLAHTGDDCLVFQMLEKIIVDQICGEISMDNKCAFLRLLVSLDSKPTRLSEQSITKISNVLPQYLIDISLIFEDGDQKTTSAIIVKRRRYYLMPSYYLFHSSKRLANLVLDVLASWVSEVNTVFITRLSHLSVDRSTRVCAIISVLLHMYKDSKMRQILLSCNMQIETVVQSLLTLLVCISSCYLLNFFFKSKTNIADHSLEAFINDNYNIVF
ncbi:hypothetical protein F511_29088 [Dorcoceras hygrometricum]|uniref:Uncharacterized protein n=1 Tax=Dorcoceras hygrometricum TaxID=472368 RepID=A0A2Z7A351_9LAMI|nr:hypothetical protein F511_29088 [Dorcoceras hygrometricum]